MSELWYQGMVALIGALLGGTGLAVANKWMGRPKEQFDESSQLRAELRTDMAGLRVEIARLQDRVQFLEAEVDTWKTKYYDLWRRHQTGDDRPSVGLP